MKHATLSTILLLLCSLNCLAQFGADYSSYGFNFVNDTHNDGLKGWAGTDIGNTTKLNIYRQDPAFNNYALEMKAQNQTVEISYDDSGYMDMNPCSLVVLLRLNLTQYTGNQDQFSFKLQTGAKLLDIQFQNDGIYYLDNNGNTTLITAAPVANQWFTYTIYLDACDGTGGLMIENDDTNILPLSFPNDTSTPSIAMSTSTDGSTEFEAEIDHLFIYSNPIKWWLGHSTTFVDDTPAGYVGTTGDRQHFLSLPNGERIGVNENGGGFITFTELTPGGPNLDPRPKFGSGGTKTLRGYFHTSNFNPVQAGISSTSGGHLVDVNVTTDKVTVENFPLHSYFQDDFIENTPLVYPDGTILGDENHPDIIDDDVYDEFGLDMRHELLNELDFNTSIENITRCDEISTVRHRAEWEYIRHPAHILQFHEVTEHQRPIFENFPGVNSDMLGANNDMGEMRHKFEFRLNYDLGYDWILWRDANNTWQSYQVTAVGDASQILIDVNTPKEQRFLVFSTSSDPDVPGAVSWYYPENDFNSNGTLGKSRSTKAIMYTEDRRTSVRIRADWRKTNWCRMNLYVRNEGLLAPPNGDPNIYEAFQFEAHQLFGTPNEILEEVLSCNEPLTDRPTPTVTGGTFCAGTTAGFSFSGTPNTIITYNIDGGANTTITLDATGMATLPTTASSTLNLVSVAYASTPNCTEPLTGNAEVVLLPIATPTVTGGTFCVGTTAGFSFSGTPNTIITYNIDGGGANTNITLDATGMATIAASNTASSTLNLVDVAYSGTPDCKQSITGSAEVIILDVIPVPSVNGGTFCGATNANFSLVGTPNTIVSYNIDGGATTSVNLDATGMATLPTTASSTLNLVSVAYASTPNCSQPISESAMVVMDGPTCLNPTYTWSFIDPCNCENPNNLILPDGRHLFADFIRVDAFQYPNPQVSLFSANANLLDNTGVPIDITTATFTDQGGGIFVLPFYTLENAPASFVVEVNGDQQAGTSGACSPCNPDIPTFTQWSLLIYGLLILNLFAWALYRKESVIS